MYRSGNMRERYSSESISLQSINSIESPTTPASLPLGRRIRVRSNDTTITDDEWVKIRRKTHSASPERVVYVPVDELQNAEDATTISSRETLDLEDSNSQSSGGCLAQLLPKVPENILPQYAAARKKATDLVPLVSTSPSPPPTEKMPVSLISPRPAHLKSRLNNQ